MSWPNVANVGLLTGVTTIRWGTTHAWAPNTSAIVISADSAEETEKIYLEQGEGLRATRIILKHGATWDFTIQDDSGAFPSGPNVGQNVVVTNFLGGGGNASVNAVVVDDNYRAARKQEGQRVIRLEIMNLIDGAW